MKIERISMGELLEFMRKAELPMKKFMLETILKGTDILFFDKETKRLIEADTFTINGNCLQLISKEEVEREEPFKTFAVIMERTTYSTVIVIAESHEKADEMIQDFDFDDGFQEDGEIEFKKFEEIEADLVSDYDDMVPVIRQKIGE